MVKGGLFHGVQLWVNLPAKDKMIAPAYQNLGADQVAVLASPDGGALVRLIAGDIGSHRGPGATRTPITFAHATVTPAAQLVVPWPAAFNALVYVLSGRGTVGPTRHPIGAGQLAVLGAGDTVRVDAAGVEPMEVLLLGGRPIREPVAQYGPFVMNNRAELMQAVEDFNSGRFGRVPADGLRPYRAVSRRS